MNKKSFIFFLISIILILMYGISSCSLLDIPGANNHEFSNDKLLTQEFLENSNSGINNVNVMTKEFEQKKLQTITPRGRIMADDGHHLYYVSNDRPNEQINDLLRNGFEQIQSIAFGDNIWVTIMFENIEISQKIFLYNTINEETKNQILNTSDEVNFMVWGENIWFVAFSQTGNTPDQKIILSEEFPLTDINNLKNEGYWITDITFGEKKWVTIFTKTDLFTNQNLEIVTELESENQYIKYEGNIITSLAYGNGQWVVVKSEMKGYSVQEIYIDDEFQKDFIIQAGWFESYDNIKVLYGDHQWIHILTK